MGALKAVTKAKWPPSGPKPKAVPDMHGALRELINSQPKIPSETAKWHKHNMRTASGH